MDSLTYQYKTSDANSLEKVTDAALAAGFDNGSSSTNNDYTYDVSGNITADKNKGIDSVKYNFLGKPVRIKFSDGKLVTYVYDAAGSKFTRKLYQGSTLQTTTHYVNGFVYEAVTSGSPVLSFFGSPEGRVVKNGSNLEYQYSIADHQGNTRVVFSSTTANTTATANFESSTNSDFLNYPAGASRSSLALFNHTASGTYSQKLTGATNSQIGVAKALKVYPGDKVKIDAYAKYYNPTGTSSNITGFALALTGAFGVSSASTGEALKAYNSLNNYGGIIAGGGSEGSTTYPKLFVNILLFDKDFNFLDAAWEQIDGGEQIGATPTAHDLMSREVTVKEAGYAYVFVSNENPTLVEFYVDDVVITHTPTNVVQYNEYYAFGMQAGSSWTRENNTNNFLYNAGTELNATTGWYETPFRGYDAALGRFMQADPMAVMDNSLTPYHYSGNDPINANDPSGLVRQYTDAVSGVGHLPQAQSGLDFSYSWSWNKMNDDYYNEWSQEVQQRGGGGNYQSHPTENGYFTNNPDEMAAIIDMFKGQDENNTVDINSMLDVLWSTSKMGVVYINNYTKDTDTYNKTGIFFNSEPTARTKKEQSSGNGPTDPPLNSSVNWLGVAGNVANIFGIGTTIAVEGPKPIGLSKANWGSQVKAGTKFGNYLGYAGLMLTAYDMYSNGVNTSNTLDATFGVISFAGPVGAAIGGVYFGANLITVGITGQTIGQHVDNNFYIIPTGIVGAGFMLIPKN